MARKAFSWGVSCPFVLFSYAVSFYFHVSLRHLRFPSNLLWAHLGLELTSANSFIAYRLSAFTQPFDTKIKLKGIQYKTEDSSHSVGLLLDIFPFENAFRISAGAYYFKLDTALSTSVDAINPIYEELINQTSGKATWERLAPYIGLGWESTQQSESSLGWHASLGALYMGKARVSFQLPDVPIPKRYVGRIQAEEDNIKNKVHKYTWYPVLSLGFTYRF